MTNVFGDRLKELREKHFPNESLRRLGTKWEEEGFGKYFYTQLSKMESGALLPSEKFVRDIEEAYQLSKQETLELLSVLIMQRIQERDFIPKHSVDQTAEAVGKLFRKIKKTKK